MAGLLGFVISGALMALGVFLLGVYNFAPARVDAAATLAALAPPRTVTRQTEPAGTPSDPATRLGVWAQRALPDATWVRVPYRELALLRLPVTWFYGRKLVTGGLGLLIAPLTAWVLGMLGLRLPGALVVLGSLGLAAALFFAPHLDVLRDAKTARAEFRRELASYVDAVALERANGSGVRQAMEQAAAVGEHWVWRRIGEELARSRWSGVPPWDALADLSHELFLPDLAEVADVLRLSGEEGTAAWGALRARTTAMRHAMLTEEQGTANADVERMSIPGALLGLVFVALLLAPPLMRIFTRT